jgi:hypothetical protein
MDVIANSLPVRAGFTQLPNQLIDLPKLNRNEKILIWALKSFLWDNPNCWPSRKRLSMMTDLSERTLVDVCASLRAKQVLDYKRRGYGGSNLYHFLDPTIEAMLDRLSAEPAPAHLGQVESPPAPIVAIEPLPVVQIAPAPERIAPVSPMGAISANSAQLSRANAAPLMIEKTQHEKDSIKKNTQSTAQARVCLPKSQFTRAECRTFAASLRSAGITNPYGYGTAIWHDGREDARIADFLNTNVSKTDQSQSTIAFAGGYDRDCQHCFGLGVRYVNGWLSDDVIECDCNQRKKTSD